MYIPIGHVLAKNSPGHVKLNWVGPVSLVITYSRVEPIQRGVVTCCSARQQSCPWASDGKRCTKSSQQAPIESNWRKRWRPNNPQAMIMNKLVLSVEARASERASSLATRGLWNTQLTRTARSSTMFRGWLERRARGETWSRAWVQTRTKSEGM